VSLLPGGAAAQHHAQAQMGAAALGKGSRLFDAAQQACQHFLTIN
jgi:hypothetical protein